MKLTLTPEQCDAVIDFATKLGIKTQAGRSAIQTMAENAILLDKKQQDYGSNNINAFGHLGVVVRLSDKIERLKTLAKKARKRPANESVMDTLRDISNYAVIDVMVLTNRWPSGEEGNQK